jgi:hypothetical protein
MANISLTNPQNVTKLLLNSTPKLGGDVDISMFANIVEFTGENNELETVTGVNKLSYIELFNISNNLITTNAEDINKASALRIYKVNNNTLQGSIPAFANNDALEEINVSNNSFTGNIPFLGKNTSLAQIHLQDNSLEGNVDIQRLTVDKTIGTGTFAVGDIVYQDVPVVGQVSGVILRIEDAGNDQILYIENTTPDFFGQGLNYSDVYSSTIPAQATYTFTVTENSGNLIIDGVENDIVNIQKRKIYVFDHDVSEPIRFSTTEDGIHNAGVEYTKGITIDSNILTFNVPSDAPALLYYYNPNTPGKGGKVNVAPAIVDEGTTASYPISNVDTDPLSVPASLLYFNARNNNLSSDAVTDLLQAFDLAGASGGTLYLDGTGNGAASGGATNPNYISLQGKSWDVQINT